MFHLDDLNARQKEAVLHTKGPLLIVAGAGAGKTRVITHRILHLIRQGVAPESILAITFTNKAAREMRDRVAHLLNLQPTTYNPQQDAGSSASVVGSQLSVVGSPIGSPWIGTFHSLGVHIIRENSRRVGVPQHFAIFDKSDSLRAIKEALRRAEYDPKSFDPTYLLSCISREKGDMVTLEKFQERAAGQYMGEVVANVWTEYEKILQDEKALDFDDLLLKTALLLQKEDGVRAHYGRRFCYIHIDEYQDTNHVQYMVAKLLAGEHRNIAVVGDGDQLIYGWRGASIKNILHFEKDYPNTKVVFLEENYRSTQTILAAANRVIEKNKLRQEKTLFTKNAAGERIGLFSAYDEAEEAAFAALQAERLIENGIPPREIAVLFRANFQSRALEEAFMNADVPYQVLGIRFFERKEVKDIIAYVRAAQGTFAELALQSGPQNVRGQALLGLSDIRRIINVPPRGLGKVTLLKIFAGREEELPNGTREKIGTFRKLLAELRKKLAEEPLSAALKWIVTKSGLEAELKKGGMDDEERLENIKELVTFATRYDHLEESSHPSPLRGAPLRQGSTENLPDRRMEAVNQFLTDVALQSDQDELKEERNAVRLMTVHASKGLEFEYVFITGLEQDLFPHSRVGEEDLTQEKAEEERRLFYVGLTRAKKKVFLTYAGVRTIFGSRQVTIPSEFIFDIDEEFLQTENLEDTNKTICFD